MLDIQLVDPVLGISGHRDHLLVGFVRVPVHLLYPLRAGISFTGMEKRLEDAKKPPTRRRTNAAAGRGFLRNQRAKGGGMDVL